MRSLVLGQVVTTVATWLIFLVVFTIFGVWQKPLESRIAAMAVTAFVLYGAVLFFRFLVARRDWDGATDVALVAVVIAMTALMGRPGYILAYVVVSTASLWTVLRIWSEKKGMRYPWQTRSFALWVQFVAIFMSLFWLGGNGLAL